MALTKQEERKHLDNTLCVYGSVVLTASCGCSQEQEEKKGQKTV